MGEKPDAENAPRGIVESVNGVCFALKMQSKSGEKFPYDSIKTGDLVHVAFIVGSYQFSGSEATLKLTLLEVRKLMEGPEQVAQKLFMTFDDLEEEEEEASAVPIEEEPKERDMQVLPKAKRSRH